MSHALFFACDPRAHRQVMEGHLHEIAVEEGNGFVLPSHVRNPNLFSLR